MITYTKLPNAEETELARHGRQRLSAAIETSGEPQKISVIDKAGKAHEVVLPSDALNMMIEVLNQLGQGNSVSLTPIHAELTTQEGADILNISHSKFIKLIDSKEIPYSRTGNRRKINYSDIVEYKARQQENRLIALAELSASDQDMDLGY